MNKYKKRYTKIKKAKLWIYLFIISSTILVSFLISRNDLSLIALSFSISLSGILVMYLGYLEYKGKYSYTFLRYSHKKIVNTGKKAQKAGIINIFKGLVLGVGLGTLIIILL